MLLAGYVYVFQADCLVVIRGFPSQIAVKNFYGLFLFADKFM